MAGSERKYHQFSLLSLLLCMSIAFHLSADSAFAGEPPLICESSDASIQVVSLPSEKLISHLQDGKRITAYKVKIFAGRLCGIGKIPMDWWITIQPERELHQIDAGAAHGVGWLTVDDVKKGAFDGFIIIKPLPEYGSLRIKIEFSINIPKKEEEEHIIMEEKEMVALPYNSVNKYW